MAFITWVEISFVYWWGKSVLVWETCDFLFLYFARGLIIYKGVAGR